MAVNQDTQVGLWAVYIILLIRAAGGAFHSPAESASISLMVPKEQLARIAGLNQTLNGTLNIISPPLGALLIGWLPMQGVLAIDVGTAIIAISVAMGLTRSCAVWVLRSTTIFRWGRGRKRSSGSRT